MLVYKGKRLGNLVTKDLNFGYNGQHLGYTGASFGYKNGLSVPEAGAGRAAPVQIRRLRPPASGLPLHVQLGNSQGGSGGDRRMAAAWAAVRTLQRQRSECLAASSMFSIPLSGLGRARPAKGRGFPRGRQAARNAARTDARRRSCSSEPMLR